MTNDNRSELTSGQRPNGLGSNQKVPVLTRAESSKIRIVHVPPPPPPHIKALVEMKASNQKNNFMTVADNAIKVLSTKKRLKTDKAKTIYYGRIQ